MTEKRKVFSANEAWKALLEKYPITETIEKEGTVRSRADQIREFREPRLMAKWDSSDSLPDVLRKNKINILPDSRTSYVLGDFLLYQEIPELSAKVTQLKHIEMHDSESIDVYNINY